MKNDTWKVSRRSFLAGTASLISAPMVLAASGEKSKPITMANGGGSYQDAQVKAVIEPFTKETGIKVEFVPILELDKVKAMQLTGNVDVDVFLNTVVNTTSGSKLGFWEKLDPALFDLKDLEVPPATDYVTFELAGNCVTWDPKKFGDGRHPKNCAEFFDLQKFPGRRALRGNVLVGTLEIALLADGVAPKDIYPLDLDRAFKSLSRIKSHLVWSATTPQDISLVQSGEVDFGFASNNRVLATTRPGGGTPLAISFEQNIIVADALAILKGAPNKENAMKLLAYYMRPEVQARLFDLLGTIPVSKKASTMLSPEIRKWQPDLNSPNHVMQNNTYWAENFESINRRFQEWRMS
ncbi:ABC transporter substrate-binding protein [Bradyrhizobium genosp. P]|uniref:ABC transporter substrate-binding protein n=1 Tax=Bradyrhizobium genosp. P TaxID=83641 RepID=UPI003CFA0F3F